MALCPRCKHAFREPADEQGTHECPRCPPRSRPHALHFAFDGAGGWEADSNVCDDGEAFVWRIHVCDDGSFDCSESDFVRNGLQGTKMECFDSLDEAITWCRKEEEAEQYRHRRGFNMPF